MFNFYVTEKQVIDTAQSDPHYPVTTVRFDSL